MQLEGSNAIAIAIMNEKDAPKTCDAFWSVLPIELESLHSSWSGECLLVVPCGVDVRDINPQENQTIFVGPGEIALFTPVEELLVFYGRGQPRWRNGPTPSTAFAKITQGLEEFAAECSKMTREGSKKLIIRRKV
ncbi:MAG: DUF3830 family protein [Candidatus Thorarchaeota archaeon]